VDAAADYFAVLGVPRTYAVDLAALEARYKELSRKLHPDRFARADPRARRASLQRTVQLNEAWRALKDPVRRAEYLLELNGIRLASDAERGGAAGPAAPLTAPPALLMEILELREELGEARLAHDDAKVQRMGEVMRARAGQTLAQIAVDLSPASAQGPTPERLNAAAQGLMALRYYQRFIDEVLVHEEAAATRREGAAGTPAPTDAGTHG
jgi:molecular chaperone HscB